MINLHSIHKYYVLGGSQSPILNNISLNINACESVAITGSSGSGKTTLMNIMGLLDNPTSGSLCIDGTDVTSLGATQSALFRNRAIGFVFQAYYLLPRLTVLENVAVPLVYRGVRKRYRHKMAAAILDDIGVSPSLFGDRLPSQLSGGQRQRVAIARALIGTPKILLADEPTGNLDSNTSKDIMGLFLKLQMERRVTLVIVTHDLTLAARCSRQLEMRDGKIFTGETTKTAILCN